MLHLKIKLNEANYISANIYKDDTASSVADRLFRHANLKEAVLDKDKKRILAQMIENRVNNHIA